MEVTPEHPIYVEGQGWLWAENLSIGDTLRRADGGTAKVLAIERVKLDAPQLVYNFTVKGPHTYFVLEVGVLVHNDGPGPDSTPEQIEEWVLQKIEADEIDDIIDWAEINAPTERVGNLTNITPEIRNQLREDIKTLPKHIELKTREGPPSPELMQAIRDTMSSDRRTAGGTFLGRTIPRGSEKYYGHLPPKPVGGSALLNGENGLRLIKDGKGNVYFAVSDLDAGVVITKNGDVLSNDAYVEIFIRGDDNINTRLTAGLQQKTGGFEVVVVDHGPHVNLMGKDVPGIPDYKIGGLSVKGAEFNYEVTSTTVKKVWLPTYIERIPGVSGDIARQYLNNVKEFRNRYFKKNR